MTKSPIVLVTVFIMGAIVLALELVASRILSTYFGGTIYTISSVLSVILAALSIGYYIGGKLGDAHPTPKVFYGIIYFGGLACLALQALTVLLLPAVGYDLDIINGPLLMSLAIFFVPCILLGMTSPFAIALLQKQHPNQVGSVAGKVFFWSTMGSILGSLVTGFILISYIGLNAIMIGSAAIVTLIGLIGIVKYSSRQTAAKLLAIGAAAWTIWALTVSPEEANKAIVYDQEGLYQRIIVGDGQYDGRDARLLLLDRNLSSASYKDSNQLVFGYTRYAALLPALRPDAKQALVIGGGNYSVPSYLVNNLPQAEVHVSEIEGKLYEISKQYFGLKDNPRLVNHVTDGRRILRDLPLKQDVIFGDAYQGFSAIPAHLTTQEYFTDIKKALSPNGIYMVNIIGNLKEQSPSYTFSQLRTFQSVFPNAYMLAVNDANSKSNQNFMVIGINGGQRLDFKNLKTEDDRLVNLNKQEVKIKDLNLSQHKIFTDDFAPSESYLAASVLAND